MTDERTADGRAAVSLERQSPEEAFGLLSNDVRIDIVRALGEASEPLAFSELYDRVDVDDTGNFNYHLDKLCGSFVRADEGYELTRAGAGIVGAIYAGTYTADATVEPIPTDSECQLCGGEMAASYADERAQIRCLDCGRGRAFSFPPGRLEGVDLDALPRAFTRWYRHLVGKTVSGFCRVCAGRAEGRLVRVMGGTEDDPQPSLAEFTCRRCGETSTLTGATLATYHPAVEAFLRDHGFDTLDDLPSQIWGGLDRFDGGVRSESPPRVEIEFEHAGERIVAEVDAGATVDEVRRGLADP